MNRRTFMEAATKSMACAGTAMFLTGKGLQVTPPDEPSQQSIRSEEFVLMLWRISGEHGDHSWSEIRETVTHPNGEVFTRAFGDDREFVKTTVLPNCYPTHRFRFPCYPPVKIPPGWA